MLNSRLRAARQLSLWAVPSGQPGPLGAVARPSLARSRANSQAVEPTIRD